MTARHASATAALVALILLPICSPAATYYVDSTAGSDDGDGRSAESALQSTAAANRLALDPGDSVLFRRSKSFDGTIEIRDDGGVGQAITIGAFGSGDRPLLFGFLIEGDYVVVNDVDVDHRKDASDAIRIRSARNVALRNMTIRNGTRDAIDADRADGLPWNR